MLKKITFCLWLSIFVIAYGCHKHSVPTSNDLRDKLHDMADEVLVHLQKAEYRQAEQILADIINKREKVNDGKLAIWLLYNWIAEHRDINEQIVQDWCQSRPKSPIAFTVKGWFYIEYAWKARGTGWAFTVSEEGWRLFEERLYKAKDALLQAKRLDPKEPTPYIRLITVCMGLNLPCDEMESYFQKAITADPSHYHAYMTKLTYLMPKWHGSEEEMLSFAREAVRQAPRQSPVPIVLPLAHWEMAKRSENRSKYLSRPEVWEEIETVYNRFLEEFPAATSERVNYAQYASYANHDDLAMRLLNEALKISERNEVVYYRRGRFFRQKREYQKAIRDFSKAIDIYPEYYNGMAYAQRGICYYRLKDYKNAIADFSTAIKLNPSRDFPYAYVGLIHKKREQYNEAISYLTKSIELNPDYKKGLSYAQRGICYYRTKQYDDAVSDMFKAIELNPNRDYPHAYIGYIYNRKEQYSQAIPYLTKAIELNSEYKNVYLERGYSYLNTAKYAEAIIDCAKCLELDPNDEYAQRYREYAQKQLKDVVTSQEDRKQIKNK